MSEINPFVLAQYPLPQHGLSRLMGYLVHCRNPVFKNLFIRAIVRLYGVNLAEAVQSDPDAYGCFNEFFTRALSSSARPLCGAADAVLCPSDGAISQIGDIEAFRLLQAKGKSYTVTDLLGGDAERARPFENGRFTTIYLSPRDYHRLHMPLDGTLREMVHVPGRLFSVNQATVDGVPDLFARNERVVAIFDTPAGPMALVLVGAIFVASIETVWHGVVTPPAGKTVRSWDYRQNPVFLSRGAEMGRFNMGSTIIVLFGNEAVEWDGNHSSGAKIRMGETLGRLAGTAKSVSAISS